MFGVGEARTIREEREGEVGDEVVEAADPVHRTRTIPVKVAIFSSAATKEAGVAAECREGEAIRENRGTIPTTSRECRSTVRTTFNLHRHKILDPASSRSNQIILRGARTAIRTLGVTTDVKTRPAEAATSAPETPSPGSKTELPRPALPPP